MDRPKQLKDLVIKENIKIHAKEAPIYETIHPQLFNWYHNRKSWNDINCIFSKLGSKPELKVLDLGCGTGFLTLKVLTFLNTHVTAVDLSKEMIAELEKKVQFSYNGRLFLINSEALAFLKNNNVHYDVIMASAFLHHLVDLRELVDLALEKLKPQGMLYIASEPLKQSIDSRIKFMFHRWVRSLDLFIFNLRLKLLKIEIDITHEASMADYQTTLGGVDPLEVISYLKGKGDIVKFSKFATRVNGLLAFISDRIIGSENTFSIIFRKQ